MSSDQEQTVSIVKHAGDALSGVIVIGALAKWLPPIAAILTIVWTAIRIYESRTVQRLLNREPD